MSQAIRTEFERNRRKLKSALNIFSIQYSTYDASTSKQNARFIASLLGEWGELNSQLSRCTGTGTGMTVDHEQTGSLGLVQMPLQSSEIVLFFIVENLNAEEPKWNTRQKTLDIFYL
jgi:hypothetical protein